MLNLFQHLSNCGLLFKSQIEQTLKQVQGDNNIKKAGFTLAEVLLVITIIGIVASLTIPGLITSVQESQYKIAFKKNFANLSNATNQILEDNPNISDDWTNHDKVRDEYGNYFTFIKTCNSYTPMNGICWATDGTKYLNDTGGGPLSLDQHSIAILNDGTFLNFNLSGGICQGTTPCLATISIDVNGFKKPNKLGKDTFNVFITSKRLVPSAPNGFYGCDPTSSSGRLYLGEACASLVLTNTDY